MPSKTLFFSYSRTDGSAIAFKLAADLKEAGFTIWMDQLNIRAGTFWDMEIEKAIESCDCLLFIQSENSVKSTNVLNEVYYALEQNKRVIPVIIQDCRTPFRLKRLNYINFTNSYEDGLQYLLKELKASIENRQGETAQSPQTENDLQLKKVTKPFGKRTSRVVLLVALMLTIAIAVFIFSKPNLTQKANKNEFLSGDTSIKAPDTDTAKSRGEAGKTKDIAAGNNSKRQNTTGEKNENLIEIYAGRWQLTDVQPKAKAKEGFLKIEPANGNKVTIDGWYKFEFFKQNDTAYFSVLNGDAYCSPCELKTEMHIPNHLVTISTQVYKIIKEANPVDGKRVDTILNSSGSNEINVSVYLYLQSRNKIIIKVRLPVTAKLSPAFTVEPFETSFIFTKVFD